MCGPRYAAKTGSWARNAFAAFHVASSKDGKRSRARKNGTRATGSSALPSSLRRTEEEKGGLCPCLPLWLALKTKRTFFWHFPEVAPFISQEAQAVDDGVEVVLAVPGGSGTTATREKALPHNAQGSLSNVSQERLRKAGSPALWPNDIATGKHNA